MDANNVTADTFSHASSVQIENTKAFFTSEKIDKSDKLVQGSALSCTPPPPPLGYKYFDFIPA